MQAPCPNRDMTNAPVSDTWPQRLERCRPSTRCGPAPAACSTSARFGTKHKYYYDLRELDDDCPVKCAAHVRSVLTERNKKRTMDASGKPRIRTALPYYPQGAPSLSSCPAAKAIAAGTGLKGSVPMFLLPLVASLVIAGAGLAAVAAIVYTVEAQLPAVRKVLAESRTLSADRAFLVQITAATKAASPRTGARTHKIASRLPSAMPATVIAPLRAAA